MKETFGLCDGKGRTTLLHLGESDLMRVRVGLVSCALESVEGRVWTSLSNVSRAPWDPRRPSASAASSPRHVRTAKARVDAMLAGCEAVDLIRHRRASSTNFTEAPKLFFKKKKKSSRALRRLSVKGVFVNFGLCSLMRREHSGLAWTPDRHVFQRVAALAQVNLTSQNVQHSAVRQHILFVASVCVRIRLCVASN